MEPNLSQALHLLNGDTVNNALSGGGAIQRMLVKERTSPESVVDELYVRCLTRKPTAEESKAIAEMLDEKGANKPQVLTDLFWSLLNSQEFMFNH